MPNQPADDLVEDREFAYSEVVAVLGDAVGAKDDRELRSLRGRLKRYQLDGLAPPSVGRGRAIRYRTGDIYDWGFALTLADLGLDPRFVVKNVKTGTFNRRFSDELNANKKYPLRTISDLYLIYYPSMFLDCLGDDADPMTWHTELESRLTSTDALTSLIKSKKTFTLTNLSDLKRRIDEAITRLHEITPRRIVKDK